MIKQNFKIQDIIYFPLSIIYGIVVWVRNRLFDWGILQSVEFEIPIISIGNITVGGTGKTPLVEYLLTQLKDEYQIATLSRGYKRRTAGFILADIYSTAEEIGDEPRQIKQKFNDVTVAVDGNRARGIKKILELKKDIQAIILDDAFQHRYVTPGISILLIDYNQPMEDDFILPYGRLREQTSEMHRAEIIIVTKCPKNIKPIELRLMEKNLKQFAYQKIFFTYIEYGELTPVFINSPGKLTTQALSSSQSQMLLLSGIANVHPFKEYVKTISPKISELSYADHYAFTAKDLHNIIEKMTVEENSVRAIITTEKDAMRLQQFTDLDEEIKSLMYYIPIEVRFLNDEAKSIISTILNYLKNNKADSLLHTETNKKRGTPIKSIL
jgi:tetraacyldisaccharide 4'-kinase